MYKPRDLENVRFVRFIPHDRMIIIASLENDLKLHSTMLKPRKGKPERNRRRHLDTSSSCQPTDVVYPKRILKSLVAPSNYSVTNQCCVHLDTCIKGNLTLDEPLVLVHITTLFFFRLWLLLLLAWVLPRCKALILPEVAHLFLPPLSAGSDRLVSIYVPLSEYDFFLPEFRVP